MINSSRKRQVSWLFATALILLAILFLWSIYRYQKDSGLRSFHATPYLTSKLKIKSSAAVSSGMSPSIIKGVYNLPAGSVGSGTIAIVDAYDNPNAESDLAVFDKQFNLPTCTSANGCFSKAKLKSKISANTGWGLEENLDIQWAHAIAPGAKILLVEASGDSGPDLVAAIAYAEKQSGVVAVSMSWGGTEFAGETQYENYFTANSKIQFFAASGDNGHASSWPAASPNVVAVGGSSIALDGSGHLISETAWSGSGGGVSKYFSEPSWQQSIGVNNSSGKRAIPDVSYNSDPDSGYAVYDSYGHSKNDSWLVVGGTSAATPQWAAIQSISKSTDPTKLYSDAKSKNSTKYFRDITSGSNGSCKTYCSAASGYDFITGLGSPLTQKF